MMDDRAERELERLADWTLARIGSAPNHDSRLEWVYIALCRAYELAQDKTNA